MSGHTNHTRNMFLVFPARPSIACSPVQVMTALPMHSDLLLQSLRSSVMRVHALANTSPDRLPAMTIGVRDSEGKIPPSVRRIAVCGGRRSGARPCDTGRCDRGGIVATGRPEI